MSYNGPTVRVQRSSDEDISDFFASESGVLGTDPEGSGTPLDLWLNGANGSVTIWYDQSGLGRHAYQKSSLSQPMIDPVNGRMDFTAQGGKSYFNLVAGTIPQRIPYTIVIKHFTVSNYGGILGGGEPGTNRSNNIRRKGQKYVNSWGSDDFENGTYEIGEYVPGNTITFKYDGSRLFFYVNGSLVGSIVKSGWEGVNGSEYLGRTIGNEFLNGQIYFVAIYATSLSDYNRSIVETVSSWYSGASTCQVCPSGTFSLQGTQIAPFVFQG